MTLWTAVLAASVLCLALKAVGYLVPARVLDAPRPARIADLLTVALLSALVVVQAIAAGPTIVVDARLPAVGVAAVLLWMRAPFLAVVACAAAAAAFLRAIGWAA